MKESVKKEIEELIEKSNLNCSIEEFKEKADWKYVSCYRTLSENFIREFEDKVEWLWVSMSQTLSEQFIREFRDKVNWRCISWKQTLSKNFIREFSDKVNWSCISKYQEFSQEFYQEFKDKISLLDLLENNKAKEYSAIEAEVSMEVNGKDLGPWGKVTPDSLIKEIDSLIKLMSSPDRDFLTEETMTKPLPRDR